MLCGSLARHVLVLAAVLAPAIVSASPEWFPRSSLMYFHAKNSEKMRNAVPVTEEMKQQAEKMYGEALFKRLTELGEITSHYEGALIDISTDSRMPVNVAAVWALSADRDHAWFEQVAGEAVAAMDQLMTSFRPVERQVPARTGSGSGRDSPEPEPEEKEPEKPVRKLTFTDYGGCRSTDIVESLVWFGIHGRNLLVTTKANTMRDLVDAINGSGDPDETLPKNPRFAKWSGETSDAGARVFVDAGALRGWLDRVMPKEGAKGDMAATLAWMEGLGLSKLDYLSMDLPESLDFMNLDLVFREAPSFAKLLKPVSHTGMRYIPDTAFVAATVSLGTPHESALGVADLIRDVDAVHAEMFPGSDRDCTTNPPRPARDYMQMLALPIGVRWTMAAKAWGKKHGDMNLFTGTAEEFAEKAGDKGLLEGFLGFVPTRITNLGSFGTGPWPLPLGTVEYRNGTGDLVSIGVSSDPLVHPGEVKIVPATGEAPPSLRFGQAAGAFVRALIFATGEKGEEINGMLGRNLIVFSARGDPRLPRGDRQDAGYIVPVRDRAAMRRMLTAVFQVAESAVPADRSHGASRPSERMWNRAGKAEWFELPEGSMALTDDAVLIAEEETMLVAMLGAAGKPRTGSSFDELAPESLGAVRLIPENLAEVGAPAFLTGMAASGVSAHWVGTRLRLRLDLSAMFAWAGTFTIAESGPGNGYGKYGEMDALINLQRYASSLQAIRSKASGAPASFPTLTETIEELDLIAASDARVASDIREFRERYSDAPTSALYSKPLAECWELFPGVGQPEFDWEARRRGENDNKFRAVAVGRVQPNGTFPIVVVRSRFNHPSEDIRYMTAGQLADIRASLDDMSRIPHELIDPAGLNELSDMEAALMLGRQWSEHLREQYNVGAWAEDGKVAAGQSGLFHPGMGTVTALGGESWGEGRDIPKRDNEKNRYVPRQPVRLEGWGHWAEYDEQLRLVRASWLSGG